jgi:hypothetical protein
MTNLVGPKNSIGENGTISNPPAKKASPSPIGNLAKNHINQQSFVEGTSKKTEIVGATVEVKPNTEKVQMQVDCPTREGLLRNTSFVIPRVNVQDQREESHATQSNEDPEVDEFGETEDSVLADFDLVKEEEVEVQIEAKEVQKDKDRGLERVDQTTHKVDQTAHDVTGDYDKKTEKAEKLVAAVDKTVKNLEKEGLVFDHVTTAGNIGYAIVRRVNINDEMFTRRLEQEKQNISFDKDTSVDKIKLGKKDFEEFCKGMGRLKSADTAALPPEILAHYPHVTKVILLDDLPIEMRGQIDSLIAQNKLPANVVVRNAVVMTAQDQKAIQKMVANYFTLSLQLYVLQAQIRQNALRSTSESSAPKTITPDNSLTTPKTTQTNTSTIIRMEHKEGKAKKKSVKGDPVQKEIFEQSQARRQKRLNVEKEKERENVEDAEKILKAYIKYFNTKDLIRLADQNIYNLKRLQIAVENLNHALKKADDKFDDQERSAFARIVQLEDITREGMKFVDVISYVQTLVKRNQGLAYNNEKIFPSLEKENLFVEKLGRFLRARGLVG